MNKVCEVCGNEFYVKPSTYERRKTCSRRCFGVRKTQKIECSCATCGAKVLRVKSELEKSVSGNVFCSNKCVGEYNSLMDAKNGIFKECIICNTTFRTTASREAVHITCSNKCQGEWQSKYRVGEKASNYRGGGDSKKCIECKNTFLTSSPYQTKHRKFCSKECKNQNWVKNTLHNEEFRVAHFEGNRRYQEERRETKPEAMTREYLESIGLVKGVDFFQEKGFFGRYYADFYIPATKTIIEVHGDYWHGNPNIYGDKPNLKPLYESQRDRIKRDKIKKRDFIERGYLYHEIWESDIYEDIESEFIGVNIQ